MAGVKITDLTPLATAASDDLFYIVDVSDTTQSPQGTSKQIEVGNMFSSGTWTPVVSNESYSEIVTIQSAKYSRVGSIVTCSLMIDIVLDAAETQARFEFSLPIASNFTTSEDATGIVAFNGDIAEFISWDLNSRTTTDTIQIAVTSVTTGFNYQYLYVTLQYEVKS